MIENPYQTPTVGEVAAALPPAGRAKLIRQEHLWHEVSIKGMGTLCLISGVIVLFFAVIIGWSIFESQAGGRAISSEVIVVLPYLAVIPIQFVSWLGLRRLRPWAKIPAGLLSGLGLFALGLGTIISIYFLYLLFGKKGRMVLSPAYQEIVAQTPEMRYRTPMWNWIVLAIVLILITGAGLFFVIFGV